MVRIVQHPIGQAALHHFALFHYQQAVGQQPRHAEIVGDDHRRQLHLHHQVAQQIEQARLHRHVQPAGRLVHKHQLGVGDQIAGDLQPLLHAAGEGGRQIVEARQRDFDVFQPLAGLAANVAIVALADGHQPLADVAAGGDLRPQPVERVLVHHAPVGAQQAAAIALRHGVQIVFPVRLRAVKDLPALRRQPRRDRLQQRGFAGAGFADDAQNFTGVDIERHVAEALAGGVQVGEPVHRQQRGGAQRGGSHQCCASCEDCASCCRQ